MSQMMFWLIIGLIIILCVGTPDLLGRHHGLCVVSLKSVPMTDDYLKEFQDHDAAFARYKKGQS